MRFDWGAIAARLRGLIAVQDSARIGTVAERLRVDERSLRKSIDAGSPAPTIDVIAALVRVYGLDPTWVLTGQYDPATHRTALEGDTDEIAITMNELLSRSSTALRLPPQANA